VMRTALKCLPLGSDTYDDAYQNAMVRIEGQVADQAEFAKQVLSWITCAERPLTTLELQHALAVEIGASELDDDNLPEINDMVAVCMGLVTIDEESNIIRLIHHTTQEFLARTQSHWFPNAQANITTTCINYLSSDAFEAGLCPTELEFDQRLRSHPFSMYAARNWGHHTRKASNLSQDLSQVVVNFLLSRNRVDASNQALWAFKNNWEPSHSELLSRSQRTPKGLTGLHLAAYFGAEAIFKLLLATGKVDVDSKDEDSQTPLSCAVIEELEAVADIPLKSGTVQADSKDKLDITSLSANNGHAAATQISLDAGLDAGLDTERRCEDGLSPLSLAARNGHAVVVQLLLERGAEINSSNDRGQTPLWWAARNGHAPVVELLLATDRVDVNASSTTPLTVAVRNGHEAVVKLLLNLFDANLKDEYQEQQTALSVAAEYGHETIVELLLEIRGVDVNSKDMCGATPLWWAIRNDNEDIMKLLLETGKVDINSKDDNGQTPLWQAISNDNKDIIQLLFETGKVDIDSKDNQGQTPLSLAARHGNECSFKLLLETGKVDINSTDKNSQTPLFDAVRFGKQNIVKLLLETGATVNLVDKEGMTPLDWARRTGKKGMIELLSGICESGEGHS
jgi:ankyrin repeat protein